MIWTGNMLTVVLALALIGNAVAEDCSPYGTPDDHLCLATEKNRAKYKDLHTQLYDATHQEHMVDFVLNVTIGMHQYLHPCESVTEAALKLFFGQNSVPDQNSSWWNEMAQIVGSHGPVLVGKRKRANEHFSSEYDLLHSILDGVRSESSHGAHCIQALIDEFKDTAASAFKAKYPNFVDPSVTTIEPHSTHPHSSHRHTTEAPTTTLATTQPTTTTPRPTIQTPAPTTTTPQPTTTTPAPVVATCTKCSMLACLLSPSVDACSTNSEEFCLTTVVDTQAGREITRACATRAQCSSADWVNSAECSDIESRVLDSGVTCRYCCFGNNCNLPPQLLPTKDTVYHAP